MNPQEVRRWLWFGKGDYSQYAEICCTGRYLETQKQVIRCLPELTKEQLDNPSLFDRTSVALPGMQPIFEREESKQTVFVKLLGQAEPNEKPPGASQAAEE